MIPVCTPLLGKSEKKYLLDCLATNWISSSGKYIELFESAFSRYCGKRYGITTTSGTTALHLALSALGIGKGDEVIIPTFSIASLLFAVLYCGATPVFADSEADTWNLDPREIEKKITKRTRAILPVHTYGHPCAMGEIQRIAAKHNLIVLEDAAEAHGAEYRGRKVGGIGDIGCFSFYGNKIITCGEGGMVVTDNKRIAERCRQMKNLCFSKTRRFWHQEVGFNYRMTNVQAALGMAQFERIDKMINKHRRNARLYSSLLARISGLTLPVERPDVKNVYWMYALVVGEDFGISRQRLMERLKENGIETRTFFIPLHRQPVLKKIGLKAEGRYPVADHIALRGLYLPSGSGLSREQIEYVCACIEKARENR